MKNNRAIRAAALIISCLRGKVDRNEIEIETYKGTYQTKKINFIF